VLYFLISDIINLIITLSQESKSINGSVGFNYRPGQYVILKDDFAKNFISLKIKIVEMDMKRGGYLVKIF